MGRFLGRATSANVFGDFSMSTETASDILLLQSYLGGEWRAGTGEKTTLMNPSTGKPAATASAHGLDLEKAYEYSRRMGYGQRAELLGKIADLLATQRERWYQIARENSGNTKADAAIDVDGSIATLKYFARAAPKLGSQNALSDAGPMRLARDPNFQALHIGVPVHGLALHI